MFPNGLPRLTKERVLQSFVGLRLSHSRSVYISTNVEGQIATSKCSVSPEGFRVIVDPMDKQIFRSSALASS